MVVFINAMRESVDRSRMIRKFLERTNEFRLLATRVIAKIRNRVFELDQCFMDILAPIMPISRSLNFVFAAKKPQYCSLNIHDQSDSEKEHACSWMSLLRICDSFT